jgi:hypothetical protein
MPVKDALTKLAFATEELYQRSMKSIQEAKQSKD